MSGTTTAGEENEFSTGFDFTTLVVVAGLTAILFAGGLGIFGFYEIPPDIDFKPFFVVYAIIALVPWGTPTIAAAVGATVGEGLLDIIEGAGADDPFGWVGYLVGFTVFGWIVQDDLSSYLRIGVAAVLGAFLQIAIEGIAFVVIANDALSTYAYVVAANTVTHGVVMGALLLVPTLEALEGRVEQMLGAAAQPSSG